jgi:hypothetical protein
VKYLILLLPLTAFAADIELSWQGCEPVCGVYQNGIQIATTDKQSFIVRDLDGRRCYEHKVCNLVDNKPNQCSVLKLKGATKLVPCK